MASKLKSLGLPESFCFAPYTNLDLDQSGGYLPCYRSKEPQGNWKKNQIVEEYNNDNMKKLRDQLWNGEWPDSCRQCASREEKGVRSTRQDYNEHLLKNIITDDQLNELVAQVKTDHTQVELKNIQTLEVRPHGMCNLACAHCNQESSTRWISLLTNDTIPQVHKEFYLEPDDTQGSVQAKFVQNYVSDPEMLERFFVYADNLKYLHFTGGEPLLDKKHLDWLAVIKEPQDIELRYHSNLQHRLYDKFFDRWNQFKSVRMFASLDVSPHFYPYFRYGSDWALVDENIQLLKENVKNLTIKATITVNFLTLLDWQSIVDYIVDNQLEMHVAFVDPPHPISAAYLPEKLRERALADLASSIATLDKLPKRKQKFAMEGIKKIIEFLNGYKTLEAEHLNTFEYLLKLDSIYNMDIQQLAPVLGEWLCQLRESIEDSEN